MVRTALTFAIALAGVGAFHVLHVPLPWLLGPIAACLTAAALGVRLKGVKSLNDGMRTVLGGAEGETPSVYSTLHTFAGRVCLFVCCHGLV